MTSLQRERMAGLIWLTSIAPSIYAFGVVRPSLIVSGNAMATASNVMAHPDLFRGWIAALWVTNILMLLFSVTIYPSLRDRNEGLARIFVASAAISIAVAMAMSAVQSGAYLVIAPDIAGPLGPNVQSLLALFTRLGNAGLGVSELMWVPAYIAFGSIVLGLRGAHRLIGIALIGMGLGFIFNSFEKLLAPHFYPAAFTQLAMTLGAIGGIPSMLWLIFKRAAIGAGQEIAN